MTKILSHAALPLSQHRVAANNSAATKSAASTVKSHATSTKAAAHQQATPSLSHATKPTATRTQAASPVNEEANESSSERLAESVKAGRSKQLSQSAHGQSATLGKLLNKLV